MKRVFALALCLAAAGARADVTDLLPKKLQPKHPDPSQLRAAYIDRLEQANIPSAYTPSVGSLWSPAATLGDLSSDYKARALNDIVTIRVSVQTTAAQSGNLASQRQFTTSSGISGLAGDLATRGVNPLFNAQSNSNLKGQGQTASNTTFITNLTGQVIAVLPNGNLAIEAEREIFMNNQHEHVVVRGVARPGDISPANVVPSASLSNLEIEVKGKGIISDSTRPPNPLTRAILYLFGF